MRMQTPEYLQKTRVTLASLSNGAKGIAETLDLMVRIARQVRTSYIIRKLAVQIVSDVRQKAWLDEVRAVQEYVRDHIRYVKDIRNVETISTPEKTLESGAGDCDDKSLLAASLLESIGHPARFVAVGYSPGSYCHVLVETRIANRWIPVETTENVPLGWYPPNMPGRMVRTI